MPVIDDYGHHPVEIAAVLKAARAIVSGKVIAVVQPHRYTRVSHLFDEFCTCFNDADMVLVADIYAAGEEPIEGVTRDALVAGPAASTAIAMRALSPVPPSCRRWSPNLAQPGDIVVCLGAGSITGWAQQPAGRAGDAADGGGPRDECCALSRSSTRRRSAGCRRCAAA